MKTMRKNLAGFIALMAFATASPTHAALTSVAGVQAGAPPLLTEVTAGGAPANVAVSLATGFPIWYKDANNVKLELCLDQAAVKQAGGATFFPCLAAPPFPSNPISFPNNFGAEAFYWVATAFSNTLTSTVNGNASSWSALLVLAQEAAFVDGIATEGSQAVFSRIRLRISLPAAGTYRVTHPFGTRDYVVTAATGLRDINQTQDIGILAADTFLTSLGDRPVADTLPAFPLPTPPSLGFVPNGVVDSNGKSIGPFLTSTTGTVTAASGAVYLADPGTDLAPLEVTLNDPGLGFGNAFTIELVGDAAGNIGPAFIPANVILNPAPSAPNPNAVSITTFQLSGKRFNDGANAPPATSPLTVSTAMNSAVSIDVANAVLDVANGTTNVHGFNPQAIGIFVTPTDIRRSSPYTTPNGGTVQRFVNSSTGKTTFTYTPATGFTGLDTFQYVAQDTGGLISAPAVVSITVENLAVTGGGAVFRHKFGKWRVEGISSSTANNTITLATDPTANMSGASEAPPVTSAAKGTVSLLAARDVIRFYLNIEQLPATAITAVHIHHGAPGANGPALFDLYDNLDGPISLPLSGQLTASHLQPRSEIGITTLQAAIDAIMAGNTYVNVHTAAHPSGEIRGQLLGKNLGNTVVQQDGTWTFTSKSMINPFGIKGVNAVSGNGVRILGIPLYVR